MRSPATTAVPGARGGTGGGGLQGGKPGGGGDGEAGGGVDGLGSPSPEISSLKLMMKVSLHSLPWGKSFWCPKKPQLCTLPEECKAAIEALAAETASSKSGSNASVRCELHMHATHEEWEIMVASRRHRAREAGSSIYS